MFWNKKTSSSKPAHKQESLRIIATAYNCKSIEVEDFYKSFQMKALVTGLGSRSQAERAMDELNAQKHIQAAKMKFNPSDTPAGLMELWSQEVLDEFGPNIVANTSAKHYLDQASEAISKNNHKEAIQLLEKALLHTDKKSRHYLQNSIGEYYLALNIEHKAIDCFKDASYNVALFEPTNIVIWNKIKANEDKALYMYFDKYNKVRRVNDKPVNEHSGGIENKVKMNAQALLEASTKAMASFGVLPAVKPEMSAKDYLVQADELAANNQHKEALTLISDTIGMLAKGELMGEKLLKPMLINALGESQLALDKPTDAGISFEVAINLAQSIAPDNEELLSKLIANRKRVDDYIIAKAAGAFRPKPKPVIEVSEDSNDESKRQADAVAAAMVKVSGSFAKAATKQIEAEPAAIAKASQVSEDIVQSDKAESKPVRVLVSPPLFYMVKNDQQKESFEAGDEIVF
ncbi:hypothetical protein LRS06_16080 [Hymenobacter sp. J193]|uniref:hypothetical protein n=1 Tax=Hymenobacter sp. J193 TaxID=2898429 RepID=UPI002151694F|nr:hypothetical protein [Hymenobacter sp. J193]MCR5889256.1 hypothetical protein [Hymenobacter sp. J193]